MKSIRLLAAAVLPALLACGCAGMSNSEKGALAGGGIGAGLGGIIGHGTGHTGLGALAGGAIGAGVGGIAGNQADKEERRQEVQLATATAAAQRAPLGLTDIVNMAQQHISDDVVIGQIRTTGSIYRLSPSDINWLKQNGVSDAVVMEMQATATRYPRRMYSATPVYVVEPAPPPVSVGVGFGYTHYGHGCRW